MALSAIGFVSRSHDPEEPCAHLHHPLAWLADLGTTESPYRDGIRLRNPGQLRRMPAKFISTALSVMLESAPAQS
jgi:hypothetical protein